MKKILFVVLVISTMSAAAQRVSPLYVKAELGMSKVKLNSGSVNSSIGLGIGAEAFVKLVKDLLINPSLNFQRTGYRNTGSDVRVNYLNLSLPLVYELNLDGGAGAYSWILGGGPFIAYALSGKFDLPNGDEKSMSFGNTTADNRKSSDAGINLKSALKAKKLTIGLEYNLGLTNLVPSDRISNGSSIKSRNLWATFSYALSGKGK